MTRLETPLIANRQKRVLSALGQKQLDRIIAKAAKANGTHRYNKEFNPIQEQVKRLVYSLVFDHNITKEQLSMLQRLIIVKDKAMDMPNTAAILNLLSI